MRKLTAKLKRAKSIEKPQGHFVYILTQFLDYYTQKYIWNTPSLKQMQGFWEHEKL